MSADSRQSGPGATAPGRGGPRAILAVLLLLLVQAVAAHRGHAVWTDIDWNGDAFEIVHRMHLADAISVNRYMGGTSPIEDLESLARVALYVEERFSFRLEDGELRPETIGAEIEDDFLFVYQEWTTPLPQRFPEVNNRVLLDIEPGAQAFVKIKAPGLSEERTR